ncbi:MAG TPA: ATP-binding protein [Candidatus Bathyarchaeia archaeon]|nr:ATP-binding protein [Candidatus Bathyarchaeia archaeon]
MSKAVAKAVADFLSASSQDFLVILKKETFAKNANVPLLEQWFDDQIHYFGGGSAHTSEWVTLFVDTIRAGGGGMGNLLSVVQRVRNAVIQFCSGKLPGISDMDICRTILEYEAELVKRVCETYTEAERKSAASAQRRLKTLANSMHNAFVTLNVDGVIDLTNAYFSNIIGIAEDRVPGTDFLALCQPDTAAEIKRELRQKRGSSARTFNGNLVTALGATTAVQFWVLPIFDANGFRSGLAIPMTKLDPGVRFPSSMFSNLVEEIAGVLGIGLYVIDAHFRVVSANEMGLFFAEVGQEDNAFHCCRNLDEQGRCRDCLRKRVFDTGMPQHATVQFKIPAGDVRWVEMTCIPFRNEQGAVTHVAKLVRDVTEQKMIEGQLLQQQRESLVWHLAASVAHQLSNPLGVMIGFAEMLSQGIPPNRVHEAVNTILRNGMRCKEIVDNLIEFGHGASGELVPTDLNALIKQRVNAVYAESRIDWRLTDGLPPVLCAPDQMALVLLHLVDNALWAAKSRVVIQTEPGENSVLVRVIDDGPGLPEEYRAHMFEPFFTTRRDEGGIGLGLCLSRRVVELHRGQLTLDESVSPGTCFLISLPAAEHLQLPDEPVKPPEPAPKSGRRILLVEDENDQLFLLALALQMQGHQSDTAKTGSHAIELINSFQYDAAVIDMLLADELGGRDLYKILQRANPQLAERTLFITGDTMKYETRRFLQEIKRPYLEKPFMIADFTAEIEHIIQNSPRPTP